VEPVTVRADVALGRGRAAAVLVLLLRSFRAGSIAVILVGIAVAVPAGRLNEATTAQLTTVNGFVEALLTPLVVLAVGLAMRLLVAPVAYLSALFVVMSDHGDVVPASDPRSRFARLRDRTRLGRAYVSLRWTLAVRAEAIERLGPLGRSLYVLEIAMYTLIGVSVLAVILSAALA
jgi:hypothetical protein